MDLSTGSLGWKLILLCFACAVVLVEASIMLRVPPGNCWYALGYEEGNGYRVYLKGQTRISIRKKLYMGVLISRQHVLVKTPKEDVDFRTAKIAVGIKHLVDGNGMDATKSVQESARCGQYTVLTLNKRPRTPYDIHPCIVSSEAGESMPVSYVFGFNPETSNAESTYFRFQGRQRTCAANGMPVLELGQVAGGAVILADTDENANSPRERPNMKLNMANFFYNVPSGRVNYGVHGHFEEWVGGEGQFRFAFSRFRDKDIKCIQKIVDKPVSSGN